MGADGTSERIPRGFKGMPEVTQTLAEATLNFVNPTGLNLADPENSSEYAGQVWQTGELLQTAIFEPHLLAGYGIEPIKAQDIFPVAQRAVDEALQRLPLIEDVNDAVRWSAERLAQELPQTAQLAQVDGLRLAEWLLDVLESPYAEQIDVDPVQYEESLGGRGREGTARAGAGCVCEASVGGAFWLCRGRISYSHGRIRAADSRPFGDRSV